MTFLSTPIESSMHDAESHSRATNAEIKPDLRTLMEETSTHTTSSRTESLHIAYYAESWHKIGTCQGNLVLFLLPLRMSRQTRLRVSPKSLRRIRVDPVLPGYVSGGNPRSGQVSVNVREEVVLPSTEQGFRILDSVGGWPVSTSIKPRRRGRHHRSQRQHHDNGFANHGDSTFVPHSGQTPETLPVRL